MKKYLGGREIMKKRPTRLRRSQTIRQLVKETRLHMDQIIYPVFVVDGENIKEEIPSMKNQYHYSVDKLLEDIDMLWDLGIHTLLLFATTDHKSAKGESGADDDGVVQNAIRGIKKRKPEMAIMADVCLCTYKEDGHCCVFREDQEIDRKKSLEVLSQIALSYARAGVDMVAPSDMMDGRVAAIREILDDEGYEHVGILAYSAKYASAFYGPFREAAHSAPAFGDRKMYQMDPANRLEAYKEIQLDIEEGADIVMVKPAMAYLDIINTANEKIEAPIAAYQVSGEYMMLRQAVDSHILDERAIYESVLAIRRSGASIVITYFAKELKAILQKEAGI